MEIDRETVDISSDKVCLSRWPNLRATTQTRHTLSELISTVSLSISISQIWSHKHFSSWRNALLRHETHLVGLWSDVALWRVEVWLAASAQESLMILADSGTSALRDSLVAPGHQKPYNLRAFSAKRTQR